MVGRSSMTRGKGKDKTVSQNAVPDVYQEMLAEALPLQSDVAQRPLKKRRIGQRDALATTSSTPRKAPLAPKASDDENADLHFEEVQLTMESIVQGSNASGLPLQTAYREFDDDSEESDIEWEGVIEQSSFAGGEPSGDLELTLSKPAAQRSMIAAKRRTLGKAERNLRLQIHKMHVLCLLSHIDKRNDWCNDYEVRSSLEPLLDKKVLKYLRPRSDLSQFSRAESLKKGLDQVALMWRQNFVVTARGLRCALWAEKDEDLKEYKPSADMDSPMDKSAFRVAAKSLRGSRDLGAQLFCALLRSAEVETRLVCSLQPLSLNAGGYSMPRAPTSPHGCPSTSALGGERNAVDVNGPESPFGSSGGPSATGYPFLAARRRLGHPNAAAYLVPEISTPARIPPPPKTKDIHESPFPVYWVEILDEAHQKWFPVDPLVTGTIAKPRVFEPPASDRENNMTYVIAFDEEGCARDVTRRYVKAFNAKTRRNRVECTDGGEKWWKKTMRAYSRGWRTDLDEIEDAHLADLEAREPMPKNVADFKGHPTYALERHMRKNEVLVSSHIIGKVAAGRDPAFPGTKKLENIYRRRDVKIARSADAWYRLGREVKMGELPVKVIEAKRKLENDDSREEVEERAGTNLFTETQTELYQAPPVVNGRVPRNSYGNLDIFLPSMIPPGGVHVTDDEAPRAARLLGIDYAEALTGFKFQGRHGTAVLQGAVVAAEYQQAMQAIIEGFNYERLREEENLRTLAALRMWKRFLVALRVKERVDSYEVEGEQKNTNMSDDVDVEEVNNDSDGGMESEEYVDDGAGGFFPE